MSERTLFRMILKDTGMSFGRWRQQFHIMLALERLAEGDSVQAVAFDLGYESASAFITMFKKALGQPPGKYLASRRNQATGTGTMAVV
jgi:AraC-like DNA-binding protein